MTLRISSRPFSLWCGLAALGAATLAGCAGVPVPTRAVAGTTFGFPLGADSLNNLAYGSATFPDPQRGVLAVEFKNGGFVSTVPVKLVIRVGIDRATTVAMTDTLLTPHPSFPSVSPLNQIVALVDIPKTFPEGPYTLKVRRFKTADNLTEANLVDEGPQENALWSNNALYIEPGDGTDHFTPFKGSLFGVTVDLGPSYVQQITPHPELLLTLPSDTSAATIDIGYPQAKMTVVGAYSFHLWNNTTFVTAEPLAANKVRLHVVDPDARGYQVSLVFKNTQTGYNPILIGEFFVDAVHYYDEDGAEFLAPGHTLIESIR